MIRLTAGASLVAAASFAMLSGCASMPDVTKPDLLSFGASLEDVQNSLGPVCTSMDVRTFDPPAIPADLHQQIDCEGFDYFGAPRLAEFVFIDDALVLTWILVREEELPALEAAFRDEFGEPTHTRDDIVAFTDDRAAVRYDTPEALYYAESVAPLVEMRFSAPPEE